MEVCFDDVTAIQNWNDISVYKNDQEIRHICCARELTEQELVPTVKGFLYGFPIPERSEVRL